MAVLSVDEMPRSGAFRFGESPELTRRFVILISDADGTTSAEIAAAVGIDIGSRHPSYPSVPCVSIELNEGYNGDPSLVEFVAQYGVNDRVVACA